MYQAHPTCVKVRDLLRKVHRSNSIFFQFSKQKVSPFSKAQRLILIRTLWCHSTWLRTWTSQEDLKFFHVFPPWKRFENEVAPRPPEEPEPRHCPYHHAGASTGGHPGHRISSGRCQTSPRWRAHPGSFPCRLPPRHCQRRPPAQR